MHQFNLLGVDRQWVTINGRKSFGTLWNSINWNQVKQIVNRLQTRIVKAVIICWVFNDALSMLEPCEVKVSRRVLRGKEAVRPLTYPAIAYPAVRLIKAGTDKTTSALPGLKEQDVTDISATAA